MPSKEPTPFDRVFPNKELFQGHARWAFIWSVANALLLGIMLVTLLLLVDLFVYRGVLTQDDHNLGVRQVAIQDLETPAKQARAIAKLVTEELHLETTPPTETAEEEGAQSPTDEPESLKTHADLLTDKMLNNEGTGILPSVWHWKNKALGGLFRSLYLGVTSLQTNSGSLMFLLITLVLTGLLRNAAQSRIRKYSQETGLEVAGRLRRHIHRQTLRLGPSDLNGKSGNQALNLFLEQVDAVRKGVTDWVASIHENPLAILMLLIVSCLIDWRMTIQCLVPLAFCWFLIQKASQRSKAVKDLAAAQGDSELRLLAESLNKTRLVRGYAMEDYQHEEFQKQMERYRKDIARISQGEAWSRRMSRLAITISVALVLFLVGLKVLSETTEFSLSTAVVLLLTLATMYFPFQDLWFMFASRSKASEAADKIQRYLNEVPDVSQAVGAKFLQPLSKSIHFEAVHYFDPPTQKTILNGLDLKLPGGQVTALVSLDPLEPRTLVYLLPRFLEPKTGRVLIDGEDIAWATLESLRAETVYVGGNDPIFTGTVLQNITCGNSDYTLTQATDAAKQAHAHKMILNYEQGYETILGEHGEQLEPGEAFRLSLARAILRDPALMIIEEPAGPLDEDTKNLIDDAYNRLIPGRTVLFLPNRLSSIKRANQIVMFHQGKVRSVGPHAALVKQDPLYRHWEYINFNQFRHEETEQPV